MTVSSLDQIVRNMLLKHRYSLHWYIDFLLYSSECLAELTLDDLHVINTKLLPINQQNASVILPSDYTDKVGVFVEIGQRLHPLVEDDSLNPIPNYSSNFQQTNPYLNYTQNNGGWQGYLSAAVFAMTTVNYYGEPTGRSFGWSGGTGQDTYKVIKSRGIIQMNDLFLAQYCPQNVVLTYISNGKSADAATHIDVYAEATIRAYINWQMAENSRTYSTGDKERLRQLYINERVILRARMSDLTITKMTRILQKNSIAMKP